MNDKKLGDNEYSLSVKKDRNIKNIKRKIINLTQQESKMSFLIWWWNVVTWKRENNYEYIMNVMLDAQNINCSIEYNEYYSALRQNMDHNVRNIMS